MATNINNNNDDNDDNDDNNDDNDDNNLKWCLVLRPQLESAKEQEENLLLSVLPKSIMQEVKRDLRDQIETIQSQPSLVKKFS